MHIRFRALSVLLLCFGQTAAMAQTPPPIIDMHLHAHPPEAFLQHRLGAPIECALPTSIPPMDIAAAPAADLATPYFRQRLEGCTRLLEPAENDSALVQSTLSRLELHNITAVASSAFENVKKWSAAAPNRIIPGLVVDDPREVDFAELRRLLVTRQVHVVGEVGSQYFGLPPSDPALEPLFALAEELDVPVGIHVGLSAPGIPAVTLQSYRAAASRPLELEPVLVKHPRLRLWVMHAGWPMEDEMLHLLWSFPQVYVDIAAIDWLIPQAEFHRYLKRLVDAGFGKRIMFGSDQMIWPEAIDVAIDNVNAAAFLSEAQRRDIFHDNAARFLRREASEDQ